MTAETIVAECTNRLEPLELASNLAWWAANTDATEENAQRRADADVAYSDALADPDAFAAIRDALATPPPDPQVARQLTVLEQTYAPQQVDADLRRRVIDLQTDVETRFARHRGAIDGESVDDNAILEILRTSTDAARRRAAWEASKTVGADVAPDLITLIELRNEAARSLGYRDHFALTLATTDYDEDRLLATLGEVDAITAEPYRRLKATLDGQLAATYAVGVDELGPWHYDDPFLQSPPQAVAVDLDPYLNESDLDALTARTYDGLGLEVRAMMARSDLLPRTGKVQHAFCIDMDRVGDVRVLTNNVAGEYWADTMLHEFGHAVHFDGISRDLPWLLRTTHSNMTEGVAMRCGRLVRDPAWLQSIAAVPATTVAELAGPLRDSRRAALLVFARWVLVMTMFERGLYANPGAAHNDRWWELVEHYQLVPRPAGRNAPDWAAKIHIAAAPVYYHNYLYGELIASTLAAAAGSLVDAPDAGRFLHDRVFAPGVALRWDHLIERASGERFSAKPLAAELAS